MTDPRRHPDPEALAAFAEGRLDRAATADVVAHLDGCGACMGDVALVMDDSSADERNSAQGTADVSRHTPRSRKPWRVLAAAAAVAVALAGVSVWREARSPMARLVALAPDDARPVEPRLSGGFAWAAYAGAERAGETSADARAMKLAGAAGELAEAANRDSDDSEAQHAAGVAMVLAQQPLEAIARLEKAATASGDAKAWSDLAAARYAAASRLGQASLYPLALADADRALRIEPRLPEALFNRALILERLGLQDEARRAWERYLAVDGDSKWAAEARQRMGQLPAGPQASRFDRDRPRLEAAAERGDAATVRAIVDAHGDRARAFAEAEYLGAWGTAVQANDDAAAARWLTISRNIAAALADAAGEALARDAVRSIDEADDAARRTLAAAHVLYRAGRIAHSRREFATAQNELQRAAGEFTRGRSPMALLARHYAASARLARNDLAGARADLEPLLDAADQRPRYVSLGAHARWELGRVRMLDGDWSGAVPVLAAGAERFHRSGARASEAFVEILLAQALGAAGRQDEAWQARARAFAALGAAGESDRLASSIAAVMLAEMMGGRNEAALALSSPALAAARAGGRPDIVIETLLYQALLQATTGDSGAALQTAREAATIAQQAPDPATRARHLADADVAIGAALLEAGHGSAAQSLSRAIAFYETHDLAFALPDPLLLRARSAASAGERGAALRDLERGMAIVEEHRDQHLGAGALGAAHALYTDAMVVALSGNETARAFGYAERLRGGGITAEALQRRLAGSGTAVLHIVALPGQLLTFAIDEQQLTVARHDMQAAALEVLSGAALTERGTAAAAELYRAIVRPAHEPVLDRARELVIVPDPRVATAPFAALYDAERRRHLVERFPLAIAANATSLDADAAAGGVPSLTALALPTGGRESTALPEAEREVAEVAALYDDATAIPAARATSAALRSAVAGVLHVAGHTERQEGGGEQALLLARDGGVERMSWKQIVAAPAARGVVVLAACETLRPPASDGTRALSLGGAFVAAGAGHVIGTLAPVGDRDARLLFVQLHRRLAGGVRASEALRDVQVDAIRAETGNDSRRTWRAVALMTRRIAPNRSGGNDDA
ncbi:MAG TPA: CHAT domain-containing protein [Thermoanaerobaculia bacterium]